MMIQPFGALDDAAVGCSIDDHALMMQPLEPLDADDDAAVGAVGCLDDAAVGALKTNTAYAHVANFAYACFSSTHIHGMHV